MRGWTEEEEGKFGRLARDNDEENRVVCLFSKRAAHGGDGGEIGGGVFGFGIFQRAAEGDLGAGGGGVVEGGSAEGGVDLVATGAGKDVGDGEAIDAARGEDLDAASGEFDVFGDVGGAIVGGSFLAGSHDAGETKIDELFEGFEGIANDVEGAMENDLAASGEFNQLAAAFGVEIAAGGENANGDASRTFSEGGFGVLQHHFKFSAAVAKAGGARANHGDDGNFDGGDGFAEGAERRSEAAEGEGAIELDAVGAALLGLDAVLDGGGADFEFDAWGRGFHGFT